MKFNHNGLWKLLADKNMKKKNSINSPKIANYNKFNALTPEVLKENESIYTEALDYAFSNNDIKNIAITGIYGAGKSTVWNTYKEYRLCKKSNAILNKNPFGNVITVSLGKYTDDSMDVINGDEINEKNLDNRVERQLINQILSQIKSNNIPLSKYRFKRNVTVKGLIIRIMMTISFIASILIWILKEPIMIFLKEKFKSFNESSILYISGIMLFLPIIVFLYTFYKENRVKLSKVNLKGAEANFKDENNDETVLDRDIKEIVYLLNSSKSTVVVFEDLDRYDNIEIFTKLRELNFLLNSFTKTNGNGRIVRFVYMIKDGLFFSKNRTKFFDFIVPIVPVVDSKTSENKLIRLLKEVDNVPDRNVLANISLYVDDMRLLKNIVNEYTIYSKIIPLGKIDLENNKLFALITLKNIFPNEFDLLQEDKGFIRTVFDNLENSREAIVKNLESELKDVNERIEFLSYKVENDKFEAMALMISADVKLNHKENRTWANFFKEWSLNPDIDYYISFSEGTLPFNYNNFLNRFVITDGDKKALIKKLPEDRTSEINKLNSTLKRMKREIKEIEIFNYKELISKMNSNQRDELFSTSSSEITENHYFPLIRFLISDGLLDETYWYYKGNFDVDTSNTLQRNDTIYMKGLLEGKILDVFLDIETPNEIINRLNLSDFRRFNILNKKILRTCLEKYLEDYVIEICDSVDINDNYKDLISILDEYELDLIKNYVDILVKNNINRLVNIMELCSDIDASTFKNVLISILTNKNISPSKLELFRTHIEKNENIISFIPEKEIEIFANNINSADIKFEDLTKVNCNKERLLQIEKIQAYKINIRNIIFITKNILGENICYGNLLNEIYSSEELISSKTYIEDNFVDFISEYIDENTNGDLYTNNENILVQIIKSNISEEYKLKYVEKNETIISNLSVLKDSAVVTELLNVLLYLNKIKFFSENVNMYWSMIETYGNEFIEYLDRNLNEDNSKDVLSNNVSICNTLINSSMPSNKLFEILINYADEKIDDINTKLEQKRVNALIESDLIEITEKNIKTLLDNSYNEELTMLANSKEQDIEDDVISKLLVYELSDDLIYMLINSRISDENTIKLIDLIEDGILIEKINPDKDIVIKNIINNKLSNRNIDYICKSFKLFELKDEFIESLDARDKLEDLDNKNLNEIFMQYVLNLSNININSKISLILTKIENKLSINLLKNYISSVKEISDISNVWENRYPLLNNSYKEKVGQALIKFGYVKMRKNKDYPRIMLLRRKSKTKLDDYLL